jgi:hypothetical protein
MRALLVFTPPAEACSDQQPGERIPSCTAHAGESSGSARPLRHVILFKTRKNGNAHCCHVKNWRYSSAIPPVHTKHSYQRRLPPLFPWHAILRPGAFLHKEMGRSPSSPLSAASAKGLQPVSNLAKRIPQLRAKDNQHKKNHHCYQDQDEDILNKSLTALLRPNQLPSHMFLHHQPALRGKFGSASLCIL